MREFKSNKIVVALLALGLFLAGAPEEAFSQQPSFNCATNRAPDEVTICGSVALSQMDRQLSDLYFTLRDGLAVSQQLALRDSQRGWLRLRAACGFDANCISRLYQQRIPQFRAILAGPPPVQSTPSTPTAPVGTRPSSGGGTRDACDAFPTLCP
jgi:uncharacterized protein